MRPWRQWLRPDLAALGVAVVAMMAAGGCSKKQLPPPPPEAGYIVARAQPVPLLVELPGRTSAFETSEVRPQVSGLIKAQLFREGGLVAKGQTLYQIDPSLYLAAVGQAKANLQSAQANQQTTSARAARYKPLAAIQAVAQQDYSDAAAAARQAVAAVAQNMALLKTAQINLQFTRVPAPIAGRIGRSLFTTGALVTAGQTETLTTIQRLDPIYVDIQQSSSDLLALRRSLASGGVAPSSAAVRLILDDGSSYPLNGTLEFAEVTVDPTTGAVTLRARFPNPQGVLLPGMYVRASLSQATVKNGILVSQAGVTFDAKGNASVMLVGTGNRPVMRTVTAVHTVGTDWLVTAGLAPGDRVIVEGLGKIKPGQAVRPVLVGSMPSPSAAGDKPSAKMAGG
jgi:membrane fusion protein (multidrug efflux system)